MREQGNNLPRALVVIVALIFAACQTGGPLAPIDLAAPGWQVSEGQAVWRPDASKPEIVGDVVLSIHPSAGAFIQFSKTLPLVQARSSPDGWSFEVPAEDKRYSGGGNPPKRLVWLQLLRALEGREVPERWTVAKPSSEYIALEDSHSGERLELHLEPKSSAASL